MHKRSSLPAENKAYWLYLGLLGLFSAKKASLLYFAKEITASFHLEKGYLEIGRSTLDAREQALNGCKQINKEIGERTFGD